jgi:hypothetical protein
MTIIRRHRMIVIGTGPDLEMSEIDSPKRQTAAGLADFSLNHLSVYFDDSETEAWPRPSPTSQTDCQSCLAKSCCHGQTVKAEMSKPEKPPLFFDGAGSAAAGAAARSRAGAAGVRGAVT